MPLAQPRQIGVHPHRAAISRGRLAAVSKVEIGDHVLVAVAQLLGHIVVPVPHRRSFQGRLGDLFGSAASTASGCGDQRTGSGKKSKLVFHGIILLASGGSAL